MKKTKTYSHKALVLFLIRFVSASVIISLFFFFTGDFFLKSLLPLFSYGIERADPSYEVREYKTVTRNNVEQIQYTIRTHKTFIDETGKTWPASDQTTGIHLSTLFIHPIITFSLLFSWPFLGRKKKLLAVLLAIPLLAIVEMIDVPVNLLYILKESYNVDSLMLHFKIHWYQEFIYQFLNTGGRQFLAILVFVISIAPFYLTDRQKVRIKN